MSLKPLDAKNITWNRKAKRDKESYEKKNANKKKMKYQKIWTKMVSKNHLIFYVFSPGTWLYYTFASSFRYFFFLLLFYVCVVWSECNVVQIYTYLTENKREQKKKTNRNRPRGQGKKFIDVFMNWIFFCLCFASRMLKWQWRTKNTNVLFCVPGHL